MELATRQLLNALPEPLVIIEGTGRIVAANSAAGELFGAPASTLPDRQFQDLLATPPERLTRQLRIWSRSRDMVPGSLEVLVNGSRLPCHAQGGLYEPATAGTPARILLRLFRQESYNATFQHLNDRISQLNSRIAEEQRGAAALHGRRQLLRAILGSINEAVLATDEHGVITFMNPVAEALTGVNETDACGQQISSVLQLGKEGSEEPIPNPVLWALQENAPVTLAEPARYLLEGQPEHWLVGRCTLLHDAHGSLTGAVLALRDVTAERQNARALADSQERLRVALKNAPVVLYTTDRELRYTWFERAQQFLPGTCVLGKRDDEILPARLSSGLVDLKQRVLNTGIGERQEVRLDLPDGLRVVDLTVEPLYHEMEIVGLTVAAFDVSARALAEEETGRREREFRQLADSMPQLVWAAAPDGALTYFNERWYEFTGFEPGQTGDASWHPILHPDDLQRCTEIWHESVRTGSPYQIEYRFWDRKTERYRWFLGRALPVRGDNGEIVRWFGTCTDIDDHRRLVEELRSANEDLHQFAYSASHDLQEPLRMIVIYSQLLKRQFGDDLSGQVAEYLRYTVQGAQRMEALVRDLLSYTEVGAGGNADERTDCNEALSSALANLQFSIDEAGASIESTELPVLPVRRSDIVAVFQNLIGNAIKYRSEAPPHIRVRASRQREDWHFSVSDNGIGIPPQYHAQIFGLFKRLHTQGHSPGTGIGLALCKKIIERYKGTIWVEAEEGKGSTFHFTVHAPLSTAPGSNLVSLETPVL